MGEQVKRARGRERGRKDKVTMRKGRGKEKRGDREEEGKQREGRGAERNKTSWLSS